MHRRRLLCIVLLAIFAGACQNAPPTQIVLVVTATPEGVAAQGVAREQTSPVAAGDTAVTPLAAADSSSVTPVAGLAAATPVLLSRTPTVPQPTPTVRQIQVAEQIFERGRMFWLQPIRQIWVMVVSSEGSGEWYAYEDIFEEGEPEFDPALVPPAEDLQQPIRGFGRLWRENPNVREWLGWATSDEFGFVTRYEYHPALGLVDGEIVSLPGYHVLYSLYGESFRFVNDGTGGTWRLS